VLTTTAFFFIILFCFFFLITFLFTVPRNPVTPESRGGGDEFVLTHQRDGESVFDGLGIRVRSLLDSLPAEFTAADLIKLRARKGQSVKGSSISMVLNRWRANHRIEKISETTWRKV